MIIDALVFGAHPDDAELAMGGTISVLTKKGFKVGIIDLSKGELGTRGSAELRQKEAFQAAIILKSALRENLSINDGDIQNNRENLLKVIMSIRRYRPKIIFAPYFNDRHPDHINTSLLIKSAMFYCGLPKIKTFDKEILQQAFRPSKLFYYMQTYTFEPSFIVDISETFEDKMNAVYAYASQFYNPKSTEPETFISNPQFIEFIKSRAQFFGFKIGKKYGEAFFTEEGVELDIKGMLTKLSG